MEQIDCSETSAFNNNQTPGKYPKYYIQHSKDGESLKSRINLATFRQLHIFTLPTYFFSDIFLLHHRYSLQRCYLWDNVFFPYFFLCWRNFSPLLCQLRKF